MTDIESSTRLWATSATATRQALDRHDQIVEEWVETSHGQLVESGREGDSVLAVFRHATDAVSCALELQRSLQRENWPDGLDLRVRIGVHTGEAALRNGHYVGAPLYRCARLMAAAHGGQVLLSAATGEIVMEALPDHARLSNLGPYELRDLDRPENLYQLIHPDIRSEFPPLNAHSRVRKNIASQLTSFVGRDGELTALTKVIQGSRLVTLVGPGGVGKTRLAHEFANGSNARWRDGILWVDLVTSGGVERVAEAVGGALGLNIGTNPSAQVELWLRDKHLLLVLDNCEHLVDAVADFCASALEHCQGLSVLTTSREPLGLGGEVRVPVGPMSEKDADVLFEQRARLVRPEFRLAPENEQVVRQICKRVDRLPLAIELVAARLGTMAEREILTQLDDRFRLLAVSRSPDRRHQTLESTIEWSYRLLTDQEAVLFRRLAVFRNGFSLDSAQQVCGDGLLPDVVGALTGLVEKSMVMFERVDQGDSRYRLLESQAGYADKMLESSGERAKLQQRHHDYFKSSVLERFRPLAGPRAATALTAADDRWKQREIANIWAALDWARFHDDDLGLELAVNATGAISYLGDLGRQRVLLDDLIKNAPDQGSLTSWAMGSAGGLAWRQGDSERALALGKQRLARVLKAGDVVQQVQSLTMIGNAEQDLGHMQEAESAHERALALLAASDNPRQIALVKNNLGCLRLFQGRYVEARALLEDAVSLVRPTSDLLLTAGIIESLASAHLGCGDFDLAERLWRESIAISRDAGDYDNAICCLGGLVAVAGARRDLARAAYLAGAYERLCEEYSYTEKPYWRIRLDDWEKRCSTALGSRYDLVFAEGRRLNLEDSIEFALKEKPPEADSGGLLSRRENEVASLVAQGMTNRAIAARLFVSERTVEGHVERIRGKLDLKSRAELAVWVAGQRPQ